MANTTIHVPANTWTLLTDADVTSVSFQNQGVTGVFFKGTADTDPPDSILGAWLYSPGTGEKNASMSDLFPGQSYDRLWAYCSRNSNVAVCHA